MLPIPPRSRPPSGAGGSSFGERVPALAGDGGAMVYLALAPDNIAHRVHRLPTQPLGIRGLPAAIVAVGEVAVVRGLLSWGRQRTNLSAVEALQLPMAIIGPRQAATMARQLQRASEACDGTPSGAVGLSARGTSGVIRGFPCPDGPVLLLTNGDAGLWAGSGRLLLELPDRQIQVLGWRVAADHLRASTPAGEIDLTGTNAEHLLTRLAPGLDEIVVRDISLRSTFTALFIGAVQRAREAATIDVAMVSWHDAGHGRGT